MNAPQLSPSLFDYALSKEKKAVGQKSVLENAGEEWREKAREVALDVARRNPVFTADDIRVEAQARGIGEPRSPNAWGSLISHLGREGCIRKTGNYRPSRIVKSHARMLAVWQTNNL